MRISLHKQYWQALVLECSGMFWNLHLQEGPRKHLRQPSYQASRSQALWQPSGDGGKVRSGQCHVWSTPAAQLQGFFAPAMWGRWYVRHCLRVPNSKLPSLPDQLPLTTIILALICSLNISQPSFLRLCVCNLAGQIPQAKASQGWLWKSSSLLDAWSAQKSAVSSNFVYMCKYRSPCFNFQHLLTIASHPHFYLPALTSSAKAKKVLATWRKHSNASSGIQQPKGLNRIDRCINASCWESISCFLLLDWMQAVSVPSTLHHMY